MSNLKIELDQKGIKQLLKSSELRDGMHDLADSIAQRANGNYETDIKYMGTRVISSVKCADDATNKDNLKNNSLLKGLL